MGIDTDYKDDASPPISVLELWHEIGTMMTPMC